MKKTLVFFLTTAIMATLFLSLPTEAAANCAALARRVHKWQNIRNNYINRWNHCRQTLGWSHPRCQRLRERVHSWYANVRQARQDYARWGCTFQWDQWSDPWSAPRPAPHHAPVPAHPHHNNCSALATQVNNWSILRNRKHAQWQRCSSEWGWSHPRCQNLRAQVQTWNAQVQQARANYAAWGCTFRWDAWNNDPWATPPAATYNRAACRNLRAQVNNWRAWRNQTIAQWNQCRAELGWNDPQCRRLRRRVDRWNVAVQNARANHRAWGCRFAWEHWTW